MEIHSFDMKPIEPLSVDDEDEDEVVVETNRYRGGDIRTASTSSSTSSFTSTSLSPPTSTPGSARPGIVHRLDKGTSGLLVVAKTDAALASLCDQFKARTVDRSYLAIACGTIRPPSGRVLTNVGRDPSDRKRMTTSGYGSTRGRTAASNYRTVEVVGNMTVCEWKLETGRTHQIRVHAQHLGHPLVMDETYGGTLSRALDGLSKGDRDRLAPKLKGLDRPALHALTLGFDHPVTGERLRFKAAPPADMRDLLMLLGSKLIPG